MLRLTRFILLSFLALGLSISACKKDPDEEPEPDPVLEYNYDRLCDNSCFFSKDGECDDGGYGSTNSFCSFGTDCDDCGVRKIKKIKR